MSAAAVVRLYVVPPLYPADVSLPILSKDRLGFHGDSWMTKCGLIEHVSFQNDLWRVVLPLKTVVLWHSCTMSEPVKGADDLRTRRMWRTYLRWENIWLPCQGPCARSLLSSCCPQFRCPFLVSPIHWRTLSNTQGVLLLYIPVFEVC